MNEVLAQAWKAEHNRIDELIYGAKTQYHKNIDYSDLLWPAWVNTARMVWSYDPDAWLG